LSGDTWLCISEGFPALPFVVNEDLTREDGVIQCRRIGERELVQLGWRAVRLLKLLREFPVTF
jgi:hypothetical protein